MNDRVIAVMALILFFIGFFVVGAVQSFIENRRRRKAREKYLWKQKFLHNFQEVVDWGNELSEGKGNGSI